MDERLLAVARLAAERLLARAETVAVAESSSGGLISAALLAVPGASRFYLGGAVVYTARARAVLVDLSRDDVAGMRSASEPYALKLAQTIRSQLSASWGVAETGAAGPSGNGYGDPPGHTCLALAGSSEMARTLRTGEADREANMTAFAIAALDLLIAGLAPS